VKATRPDRLSLRDLNRATLDRQLLLRRNPMPARQAIEHLGGLQAQAPLAPYVGLWTRLAGFRHQHLEDLLTERTVVRAHLMRNTIHLLTAADFVGFRPLFQPLMDRGLAGNFGPNLTGVDLAELRTVARTMLAESPLTRGQLGERLAPRWPGHDPASLAYAATHLLYLVQVPPRGLWGRSGQATWFLADAWLDGLDLRTVSAPDPAAALDQIVLRYLGAYGPASVNDIQAWSGLSRLRDVTDRLGARLRTFTGPDGGELLDLADAQRPGLPSLREHYALAPPRFLPEYDNLLLSFADRSRFIRHDRPVPLPAGQGATTGTLLVDGFWQADWRITKARDQAALEVRPFIRLGGPELDAVVTEGGRLLEFAAPAAAHDVRFTVLAPGGRPPQTPPSGGTHPPGPPLGGTSPPTPRSGGAHPPDPPWGGQAPRLPAPGEPIPPTPLGGDKPPDSPLLGSPSPGPR
jgi:Winged helix DNA-binding domain